MDSLQLAAWLDSWSSRYPADYDAKFATYAGREAYGPDDLEVLYNWKFTRLWPAKKIRAMRAFPERDIWDLTRRSFICDDPLGALLILCLIPGLQAAGASAVLAAQAPDRYTVMDVRALASLEALGLWDSRQHGDQATAIRWPLYLQTCLELANKTGKSLRAVDRALYKANGAVPV
ncbi:hypothetical protein [Pseudonocardia sp. WMMC193]|uniref:hypothetical protein n=1 Tax=Pseudonocardia sp. WMMC193 TaxID=2911965 RepID=UPI001F363921|nr:hypothetical protein [Pseudonocardia sp. WMMC193]MCF7547351.1 hypothetical protein [Pseudonocardia sp. WMMC193]